MADEELHKSAYLALRTRKYEVAKKLYSELAAAGSPTAWINLGWMYQHAAGVSESQRDAKECYEKAANLGYLPANYHLARLLLKLKEYERVFALFSIAADAGHVPSSYWLGRLYLTGRGIGRDALKAEQCLKEAMDKGHIYASRDYHRCRLRGEFGERRFSDFIGWISALVAGVMLAFKDPYSELLY